jgi:5'(3')-deoxyribonucleotidase
MKPKLALDMDGVLVDFLTPWIRTVNSKGRTSDFTHWNPADCPRIGPRKAKKLFAVLKKEKFWTSLKFLPGARRAFAILNKKYDVYMVTSAYTPGAHSGKLKWLRANLPEFDTTKLIFIHDKALLRMDIAIDDRPETLQNYKLCSIPAFGLKYKYNEHLLKDGYSLHKNWSELLKSIDFFEKVYKPFSKGKQYEAS